MMPIGEIVGFAIWLLLAMAAAILIVFAWERLRRKSSDGGAAAPAKPQ